MEFPRFEFEKSRKSINFMSTSVCRCGVFVIVIDRDSAICSVVKRKIANESHNIRRQA